MPSKSKAQSNLMRACVHGWKPSGMKCPPRKVAEEFMKSDMKEQGKNRRK